ncbi:tyrosyl-tRNA synthetase [compost metagenome]
MKILTEHSLVQSKKEVRRLMEQGGIKINDTRTLELENIKLVEEMIIQIGKKKFIKIIIED